MPSGGGIRSITSQRQSTRGDLPALTPQTHRAGVAEPADQELRKSLEEARQYSALIARWNLPLERRVIVLSRRMTAGEKGKLAKAKLGSQVMEDVNIVNGVRTAPGAFEGRLAAMKASDLGTIVMRDAMARAGLYPIRSRKLWYALSCRYRPEMPIYRVWQQYESVSRCGSRHERQPSLRRGSAGHICDSRDCARRTLGCDRVNLKSWFVKSHGDHAAAVAN